MVGPATIFGGRFLYLGREKTLKVGKRGVEAEMPVDDVGKTRIVVLGKHHYYETIHSFPFANLKEIREAVIMDISAYSPFDTPLCFVKKMDIPDGGCRVNLWFIHPDAVQLLNRLSPMILIPESGLLALAKNSQETLYHIQKQEKEALWVYVGKDLLTQSMNFHNGKIEQETFTRIIGGNPENHAVSKIADMQVYLETLHRVLMSMPFSAVLPFLFPIKSLGRFDPKYLKIGLSIAAGLCLLYGAATATLLYSIESGLMKADREIMPQVTSLMKDQQQAEELFAWQNELSGILRKQIPKLPLLILLNEILPKNTTIFQLVAAGNTVEIKGITPKSTELLEALTARPVIQNARYTAPIRQDQASSMELFTLSFLYNPTGVAAP